MPQSLRDAIEFHVDKGLSRRMLLKEVYAERINLSHPEDVEVEVDKMLAEGVLTMGLFEQEPDHVVVTRWSPNTAAKMRSSARTGPA